MKIPYKQLYGHDFCPIHPATAYWPVDSVLSYRCDYGTRANQYLAQMRKIRI